MRRALGIRRSWRQKVAPFMLLARRDDPGDRQRRHRLRHPRPASRTASRSSPTATTSACRRRCCCSSRSVAPDVMCPDRRQRVLPLMFARPLTGTDYVAAKVGAIGSILFVFSFVPQVVLFVGNMLVSDSALDYLTGHLDVLWKVPVAVVLLAVYYAVIGVAIASLTDRRIVAGAAVIGLFLITSISSGDHRRRGPRVRRWVDRRPDQRAGVAVVPARPHLPRPRRSRVAARRCRQRRPVAVATYVAVLVVCVGVLLRRYRWVER